MVLEEFEDTRNTLKRQSGLKNSVPLGTEVEVGNTTKWF
jgi:hypothetical protein